MYIYTPLNVPLLTCSLFVIYAPMIMNNRKM